MSDIKRIEEQLDAKIPRDVVELRDGGGGKKLSYLTGHYVIDRLNKIFGPLNWNKEIIDVRQIVNTTRNGEFPAYLVKVRLTVTFTTGEGNQYGYSFREAYGYGCDKSSQNAHELAIKEAVTDALKVAAKDLGMSLGLALYDKTQENVDDGEQEVPAPSPKSSPVPAVVPKDEIVRVQGSASATPKTIELIERYIKVARAQKKSDKTKDHFSALGVTSPEEITKLSEEQLQASMKFLEELTR